MEESVLRDSVSIERLAAETAEQALVEGEVALPGGIREEATVLSCDARLVVSSVEPQADRLAIDGTVVFQVLYRQGDDTVRALEANCAFSHQSHLDGIGPKMRAQIAGEVQSASAQPVSGRMRLKAAVDIAARVFSQEQLAVVSSVGGIKGLQTRQQSNTLTRHASSGRGSALLREEFDLKAPPAIRETLYAKALPHIRSVSGGEGRAMVEGDVLLEVYHAGTEPEQPLVMTQHLFPFEHAVELDGAPGDGLNARVQVQDVVASSVDTGDGTRVLRTETVLDLEVESFAEDAVTSLKDAYTLSGDALSLETAPIACFMGAASVSVAESDKLTLTLPEGAQPVAQVLAALLKPTMTGSEQVGGRTVVEGLMDAQVVYMPVNGTAAVAARQEVPFRIAFQGALPANANVALVARDVQAEGISGERVEMKYRMEIAADAVKSETVSLPLDVKMQKVPPERSGLVMIWPQPGEMLWDIAKRLRVTTDSVVKLNPGLDVEKPSKGVLVFKKA